MYDDILREADSSPWPEYGTDEYWAKITNTANKIYQRDLEIIKRQEVNKAFI